MEPTIQLSQVQPVAVQVVLSTSQVATNGEAIITLDLETDMIEPIPGTSRGTTASVHQIRSGGKGVKRNASATFTSSNTAKTYGDADAEEDDLVQYPAYLYQEPPSKLKVEDLRKHALIAKIKKDTSIYNFFELAKGILTPMKSTFLTVAGHQVPQPKPSGDHEYGAVHPSDI